LLPAAVVLWYSEIESQGLTTSKQASTASLTLPACAVQSLGEDQLLYWDRVVEQLEQRELFNCIVKFVRLITGLHLRSHADHYAAFVAGSDSDRQNISISQLCSQ
jgi:Peptidase C65 Otubain